MLTQGRTGWSALLSSLKPNPSLVDALARALLSAEPAIEPIVASCTQILDREWHWLRRLARRYLRVWTGKTRPRHREVVHFLLEDEAFQRVWARHARTLSLARCVTDPPRMRPVASARHWTVPVLESAPSLAEWLSLTLGELEWFSDLRGLESRLTATAPQLRHYHYRTFIKPSGTVRLIESPKPRLKELQRRILLQLLDPIPLHSAAHGFRKERSIRTFTAPHAGRAIVLRMDLKDFFPSIRRARVQALFRTAGYPERVADLLGGLCTNAAPTCAWNGAKPDPEQSMEMRRLYGQPHLPQGAPTSPALANLCAYRMDCRLAGLAAAAGATYTRYADDLAFSGGEDLARSISRFSIHVAAVVEEEGFSVHHRKTRIMRQGVRQQLTGLVVNQHVNLRREDLDRLKATLTNCIRFGPESQNRESHPNFREHLEGRIGFVAMINPQKTQRLRRLFQQISWD